MKMKGDIIEVNLDSNTLLIKMDNPIVVKKRKVVVIPVEEYIDLVNKSMLKK